MSEAEVLAADLCKDFCRIALFEPSTLRGVDVADVRATDLGHRQLVSLLDHARRTYAPGRHLCN